MPARQFAGKKKPGLQFRAVLHESNKAMAIIPMQQVLTMTSREIAQLCDKRHTHVMDDCRKLAEFYAATYSAEKSAQFVKSTTYTDSTGRVLPCYELSKQASLDLVTGYSLPHRHAVNRRWQELEAAQAKPAELSRMDILKLAMESEQARIEAEKQLAMAAPKVEFVDRYTQASSGSKGFRQVCKLLGVKEPVFRQFLHDTGVMYRLGGEWAPYAQHIEAGRFEVKTGVAEHEDGSHAFSQAKFTAKGVEWIAGEWAKAQVRGAA